MLSIEIWFGVTDERANAALIERAHPLARAAMGRRLLSSGIRSS